LAGEARVEVSGRAGRWGILINAEFTENTEKRRKGENAELLHGGGACDSVRAGRRFDGARARV